MTNVVPLRRKPRDHHGEMLGRAIAIDPRPFTQAEMKLNGTLADCLDKALRQFCKSEFPILMKVK